VAQLLAELTPLDRRLERRWTSRPTCFWLWKSN